MAQPGFIQREGGGHTKIAFHNIYLNNNLYFCFNLVQTISFELKSYVLK